MDPLFEQRYMNCVSALKEVSYENINWAEVKNILHSMYSDITRYEHINLLLLESGRNYMNYVAKNYVIITCPLELMRYFMSTLGMPPYMTPLKLHNLIFSTTVAPVTGYCYCFKQDCLYGPPYPDII